MSKDDLLENYAGVAEVSKRLNIHPESVRRLIRQGKLPAIKFGNKWLVEKATLDQYASRYDPRPGNKARATPGRGFWLPFLSQFLIRFK